MLTKWTYPLFLIVPLLFNLFTPNISVSSNKARRRNIFLSFLLFFTISSTWYHPARLKIVLLLLSRSVKGLIGGTLSGGPPLFSPKVLFHYFFIIIDNYSFVYCFLFLIAVATLIHSFKTRKEWLMLIMSILVIYVVCTIVPNKDTRHILPIYIYLATISALGISAIKTGKYNLLC